MGVNPRSGEGIAPLNAHKIIGLHGTFLAGFSFALWGGNLNDWSNSGARCVNANNDVGNARWNILRRLSD